MSKVKALKSTYINYYVPGQLEPENVRLTTLNGMDVKVFYKTDYNTYIPNGINYIIGLLGHWGRKRTRPQEHVFISNKNLVKNIGCSYGHASYVMDQIKEIFKVDMVYGRGRSKSRKVKITNTLIDFMKVFNDDQLQQFIIDHNIDRKHEFALQQVYRYIGWGIAPAQLKPEERKQRKEYMSDEERRNYWHSAATSDQKNETRIKEIDNHIELLSESQQKQFDHLKKAHTPGKKLIKYWYNILIKLQQIVSWLTRDKGKAHDEQATKHFRY